MHHPLYAPSFGIISRGSLYLTFHGHGKVGAEGAAAHPADEGWNSCLDLLTAGLRGGRPTNVSGALWLSD